MIKRCIICGKKFNATGRHLTCGHECSKEHKKAQKNEYRMHHKEIALRKQWKKIKLCERCGNQLEHANMKVCIDCHLRALKGFDEEHVKRAREFFYNHGYDKEMIQWEMEARGIK